MTPVIAGEPVVARTPTLLYSSFHSAPPAAVQEALEEEVATIMEPTGFRFAWRSLLASDGAEVSGDLAVVNFKGHCDLTGLSARASAAGALGWTHVSDGVVLPFSDIDCDGIRDFLGRSLMAYRPAEREALFGRALGRVLAHELYHIFAATTRHGDEGVAKPMYSVQDLLNGDFRFEDREAAVLKSSKTTPLQ